MQRLPQLSGGPVPKRVQRPEGAGGGGPKSLVERLDEFEVVLDHHVADQAAGQVPAGVHGAQRMLADDFLLRAPHLEGRRILLECPEAGGHVEHLVVQQGTHEFVQLPGSFDGLFLNPAEFFLEDDTDLHRGLDVPQVAREVRRKGLETRRSLTAAEFGGQLHDAGRGLEEVQPAGVLRRASIVRVASQLAVPGFRHQTGRSGRQVRGELSDLHRVGQGGNVFRIDFALDAAHLEERDERDDARHQGEQDGRSEAGRDLDPEAPAQRELPAKPAARRGGLGGIRRFAAGVRLRIGFPGGFLAIASPGRSRTLHRQRFAEGADDRKAARLFRFFFRPGRRCGGCRTLLGLRRDVRPVFGVLLGHPFT